MRKLISFTFIALLGSLYLYPFFQRATGWMCLIMAGIIGLIFTFLSLSDKTELEFATDRIVDAIDGGAGSTALFIIGALIALGIAAVLTCLLYAVPHWFIHTYKTAGLYYIALIFFGINSGIAALTCLTGDDDKKTKMTRFISMGAVITTITICMFIFANKIDVSGVVNGKMGLYFNKFGIHPYPPVVS